MCVHTYAVGFQVTATPRTDLFFYTWVFIPFFPLFGLKMGELQFMWYWGVSLSKMDPVWSFWWDWEVDNDPKAMGLHINLLEEYQLVF